MLLFDTPKNINERPQKNPKSIGQFVEKRVLKKNDLHGMWLLKEGWTKWYQEQECVDFDARSKQLICRYVGTPIDEERIQELHGKAMRIFLGSQLRWLEVCHDLVATYGDTDVWQKWFLPYFSSNVSTWGCPRGGSTSVGCGGKTLAPSTSKGHNGARKYALRIYNTAPRIIPQASVRIWRIVQKCTGRQ